MPGKTTATIDRERRDALYELALDHLSGIGDFWIAIEEKDFAKAERLGIEFGEDFHLLEDIGWEPEHDPGVDVAAVARTARAFGQGGWRSSTASGSSAPTLGRSRNEQLLAISRATPSP